MALVTAVGYINYFKTGTITATSSLAGLGATNLASDQCAPSTGWQTGAGVVTASSGAVLRVTSATTGSIWRAFALVNTNLTGFATITATLWRNAGPTSVGSLSVIGPLNGYRQVVGLWSSDITADYLEIRIDDGINPDGHINIGGAFAGPMWFPLLGVSWSTTYGRTVNQIKTVSRGGQEFRNRLYDQRYWNLALTGVRNSETWDSLGELVRIGAMGGNVLFVPDVTSIDVPREAVFGPIDSQADVSFPYTTTDARAWRAQIAERL